VRILITFKLIFIYCILEVEYSQYWKELMNHLVDIWIIAYRKIIFMDEIINLKFIKDIYIYIYDV